jgi:hypothetical protein
MTGKLTKTDRALLSAAARDLRSAPQVLGPARADALRSRPFSAKYPGICPRCQGRIALGDEVRYDVDYFDPVHTACREASARAEPRRQSARSQASPICKHCWTEHAGECF